MRPSNITHVAPALDHHLYHSFTVLKNEETTTITGRMCFW